MCIAIHKPKGLILEKTILNTCFKNNSDGMGYMFVKDGKIVIKKELKDFEKFWNMYEEDQKENLNSSDFVVHFRSATSGEINEENCHPFIVNEELAFCHNGVLSVKIVDEKFSDTVHFNNDILKKLPKDWLKFEGIVELVEKYIESSKMVFLTNNGDVFILNKTSGVVDGGIWYSNEGYKYIYVYRFADKTYKMYSSIEDTKYCNMCNCLLLDSEVVFGFCTRCIETYGETIIEDYDNTLKIFCFDCGAVLITISEKYCGLCENCFEEEISDVSDDTDIPVGEVCYMCGVQLTRKEEVTGVCKKCEKIRKDYTN
jgi:predicted glutamine amidotransferase